MNNFVISKNADTMKGGMKIFISTFILLFGMNMLAHAQDDVYYDPGKDASNQSNYQNNQSDNSSTTFEQNDNRDGYSLDSSNSAYKYDSVSTAESTDQNGNTYVTNNYYNDDDYSYTSRLRRYYMPNYGVDYYSYCFTPSFYFGWNSWNSPYLASVNPWYSDPWWSWNRRAYIGFGIDPFYDPYWNWNFGWNSFSYYNSWNYPYYGCGGLGYGYNSFGNRYGEYYGRNGGYGGRHDGYWNTAYVNGYF